jgi:hypothetical protein
MRIGVKMHYLYHQLRDLTIFFCASQDQNFSKIHKIAKNYFWPKQKNTFLMLLNDKPNCQVSRILNKTLRE